MANLLNQNPWIIDTPGTGVLFTSTFRAKSVRWVSPTAIAGDSCVIKNASGQVKWESVASGANYVEESRVESDWEGLDVETLGSGKLYIEHY